MSDQIDKIVNIVITRQTSAPTMASFNDVLIIGEFDVAGFSASARVKEYSNISALAEAGFDSGSYVYKCAAAVFAQSPHINKVYIGWKDSAEDWTVTLNKTKNYNNDWYAVCASARSFADQKLVADWVESAHKLYITVTGEDIDKGEGVTAADGIMAYAYAKNLDRTAVFFHPDAITSGKTTVTSTIYKDADGKYLDDDDTSGTVIFADDDAIPATATVEKVDPQPAGVASGYEAYSYSREEIISYALNPDDPCIEGAIFGLLLTKQAGSLTWALKQLSSVAVYDLDDTSVSNIERKHGNWYMCTSGIPITFNGKVGSGEYIDVIHGMDWLEAYMQNQVYTVLVNHDKVPYTDTGVQMIVGAIKFALEKAVQYEILTVDYEITYPEVADVSTTDKGNRHLPDVNFTATLAGAIHTTKISGTVSV